MTALGARCLVDLGTPPQPTLLKLVIEKALKDASVRLAIERYLGEVGVQTYRTLPVGWFAWQGANSTRFAARCADPPGSDPIVDGFQPWNYYVLAEVEDRSGPVWRASGIGPQLIHDRDPRLAVGPHQLRP